MGEVVCPFCKQDYVVRASVADKDFSYCPECDSTWPNGTPITEADCSGHFDGPWERLVQHEQLLAPVAE